MAAILKSTGERGFAFMDERTGLWQFVTVDRSGVSGRTNRSRYVLRGEIVLLPGGSR